MHEKYEYTIPQFPVLHVELVRVKYLIVEGDEQYRFNGFTRSDPALHEHHAVSIPSENAAEGWIHVACKHRMCHSNLYY